MFRGRRRRREEDLAAKDRWRTARKLMDEDITVLGEQVAELHLDTLADDLDPTAHDHYRRALENYDRSKELLSASQTAQDVEWSPPGGVARRIGVCAADARALAAGDEPLVRMVRVGDRWVPWHLAASVTGAVDAGAQMGRAGHGPDVQRGLAQAYINQATSGGFGNGPFG